jgi:Caspase domain
MLFDFQKIIRKANWTLLFIGSAQFLLTAQRIELPKEPLRETMIGAPGREWINALSVNWQGQIAAAGVAGRSDNGGDDVYFLTFDDHLKRRHERRIGRSGDDGANHVTASPEGYYLLAGYSTTPGNRKNIKTKYFGGKDAWLLWLDETGRLERELVMGGPRDDEFIQVAVYPDGGLAVVGNYDQSAWLLRLDGTGKVLWEKKVQYHRLETKAHAAVLTVDNELFIVGRTKEDGVEHLWFAGYDASGNMISETIFPTAEAKDGQAIVELDRETLAIAGNVYDPRDRENGFYCTVRKTGELIAYKPLGGRESDAVFGLLRSWNGALVTAGSGRSFERGSRRDRAWIRVGDRSGKKQDDRYYGSKWDDEARTLLQHPDGRLLAAGFTGKNILKSRQAWVMELLPEAGKSKSNPARLKAVLGSNVAAAQPQRFLLPGHRGFVPIALENTDTFGFCGLRATLEPVGTSRASFLRTGTEALLPPAPAGGTVRTFLPFHLSEDIPPGRWSFKARVFHGKTQIGAEQIIELQVGEIEKPQLVLELPDSFSVDPLNPQLMSVTVHNAGHAPARGVVVSCANLPGLAAVPPVVIGDLAPGKQLKASISFRSTGLFAGGTAHFRAADADLASTDTKDVRLLVNAAEPPPKVDSSKNYVVAVWVSPNPDNYDHKEIVWNNNEITVQIKIVSNRPVEKRHFCLEINGRPCETGVKFDEVQIKGNKLSKTFRQTAVLKEGKNEIRAIVNNEAGKVQSEVITVLYTPSKPNLHIIAIGVPGSDLKYTARDAAGFARALGTGNTAFQNVFIDTLVTETQTTKTEVLKAFRRLQYRHSDLQIRPQDLLVVFVSSHGFSAEDGGFRIATADFDGPFMRETSLDFEKEILQYLQPIQCRKLMFVDACHSGAAFTRQSTGEQIATIAAGQKGINLLLSCRSNEYSYEDEAWGHGAFTKALLTAFKDFRQQSGGARYLDVNALFSKIEKEIPQLVAQKKPKTQTGQHPGMILTSGGGTTVLLGN